VIQVQRICSVAAIIFCLTQCLVCPAGLAAEPKRVMLLHSFGREFRPWSEYAKAIRIELNRQSPWPLDILDHSLISARFSDPNAELAFVEYLRALYSERPLDLIISIGAPAAGFVQRHRDQLFPITPMLFTAVEQRRVRYSNLTESDAVVALVHDFAAVFENILRVLPDTKTVAVVNGKSSAEQFWEGELRREAKPFESRITFKWYSQLSFKDILKDAAALPPRSAILWESMSVDAAGVVHQGDTALTSLHSVANAPIFSYLGGFFDGRELVGGPMHSVVEGSRQTVAAAIRILGGEKAADIKAPAIGFATPQFNWKEMQRWGISESSLPPGSEIRFRDLTVWEQYRIPILAVITALLLQSALIAWLIYEHRRRRIAEADSHQRVNELARMNRFATAGEMSASIAHELRQPLTAISISGQAGLSWLKRQVPNLEEVRANLEAVVSESHHADDVIKGVRAMFKPESTARAEVNLNELVQQVMAITARSINSNNIVLDVDLTDDPPPLVMGDPVQLQQVILNLVTNAVDAMRRPGHWPRVLRLRTYAGPVDTVLLRVTDTGPGVDPEVIKRMFQPFFTTKSGGMGMGLSICKTIIEAHGGKLTASSNNPHGMELQFSLPHWRSVERQV
jgi:signal transduction histidine kinase